MAETPSTMLPLGTKIPEFRLRNPVDGAQVSAGDFPDAKALVVMFICNHCPFVKHVKAEIGRLGADYRSKGVATVAINSNDLEAYPQDGPEAMKALAKQEGWTFPFLFDDTQEVAQAFHAACTPDFFLFDGERKLVYRGQLDGSRPGNDVPVTGRDLRAAIDAVLAGKPVPEDQRPSIGCNIKWKPGHEPPYFG